MLRSTAQATHRPRCGWVVLAMLGLLSYMNRAEAASAENEYVTVSCGTAGVENIVVVGDGFHLTTVNVGESFSASVQVVAQPGWELLSAASLTLSPGGISVYTVRNIANPEIEESGDIILFKVDVEISGIGEDKEETEGALAGYADCGEGYSNTNCLAAMKSVTIRCLPANRPDDEEITLSFPSGHLLEKVGATYQIANSSYKACEIGSKSFWLHGHTSSTSLYDYEIKAEHSVNGCKDVAKYTVVKVDILDPAEGDVHLKGEEITYDGMVEPSGLGGMVFSWSLLEGTCNPSSAATEDFQTTLMSEGNIKVKFAVTIGGAVFEATRFISAMLPEVVELSWIDDLAMEKWKGDAIVDPVWKKTTWR